MKHSMSWHEHLILNLFFLHLIHHSAFSIFCIAFFGTESFNILFFTSVPTYEIPTVDALFMIPFLLFSANSVSFCHECVAILPIWTVCKLSHPEASLYTLLYILDKILKQIIFWISFCMLYDILFMIFVFLCMFVHGYFIFNSEIHNKIFRKWFTSECCLTCYIYISLKSPTKKPIASVPLSTLEFHWSFCFQCSIKLTLG